MYFRRKRVQRKFLLLEMMEKRKNLLFLSFNLKYLCSYTFLFKGQENLYIDARLMQLLRMCNTIFADPKNQRQMDTRPPYHTAATYSVTPLGARCGLIQWVEGSTPLFQLYWKWRVRRVRIF